MTKVAKNTPARKSSKRAPPSVLEDGCSFRLSGRLCVSEGLQVHCDWKRAPRNPIVGDVKVMCRLDGDGLSALFGGHCNVGYSGRFHAIVFDGKNWRDFNLTSFVCEGVLSYRRQKDKAWKAPYFFSLLESLRLGMVTARGGAFYFDGEVCPSIAEQKKWVDTREQAIERNSFSARPLRNPLYEGELKKAAQDLVRTGQPITAVVVKTNPQVVYIQYGDREIAATLLNLSNGEPEKHSELVFDQPIQVRAMCMSMKRGVLSLYVVRACEDLPEVIRREFATMGGVRCATIIDHIKGPSSSGVFLRVCYFFRARLFLSDLAGATHEERKRRLESLSVGDSLSVELVSVVDNDGYLRIKVKEAPVEK